MADQISDQSGDEKAQRLAEMKRKMQEAAKRTQAAREATATRAAAPSAPTAPVSVAAAPAAVAEIATEAVAVVPAAAPAAEPAAEIVRAAVAGNGAADAGTAAVAVAGSTVQAPEAPLFEEEDPAVVAARAMTRRELLIYTWGAATLALSAASGAALFQFTYPRFRAGEFGGKFFLGPESSMPPIDAPPKAETSGKFWLVNTTDEGVKAIYMVCTHLGCLYKWEPSTVRFECPCHGSKFSREGFYIEGPAPRSLDRFTVTVENGEVVVDTGKKITGNPSIESPARHAPA